MTHFYRSKGLQPLRIFIQLSFSASGLRDLDVMSKSDPMVVVYAKKKNGNLEEVGRTEVIMNTLNPTWIQKINVAFHFEIVQPLVFRVYDVDTKYHNMSTKMLDLKVQDYVGEANCVLSEIMTHRSRSMTLKLVGGSGHAVGNMGSINVHAEETIASKMAIETRLRCSNLDNKDKFSKSDPFLRISRVVEVGSPIPICKTEVVNNNLDPVWKPLCIHTQQYVSKSVLTSIPMATIHLSCKWCTTHSCAKLSALLTYVLTSTRKWSNSKLHTSIQGLENLHKTNAGANFVLPSSRHKGHEKALKGKIFVGGYEERELYSFLDYISSGFELNFMVAVDFTASNGDPRSLNSLHYIDYSGRLNAYQQAIIEVGEVIQVYDYDKRFPAWGFGGKLHNGSVSHCFNLNGNDGNFEVEGVQGIMDAYRNALHTVSVGRKLVLDSTRGGDVTEISLHGPTLFGHVVNQAAEIAAQSLSTNHTKYFILLFITDGVLTDLQGTIDALVRASDLRLSILIVGVGNDDFKQMEILDADTPLAELNGKNSYSR
ncbi:protein BONZAI 3-like [Bidens hawaiensis]|uniref:protein BONZAI 3-like n=1 Tax=Bidens hawaiensis TaxID=980011 RepID=UPI00404B4774